MMQYYPLLFFLTSIAYLALAGRVLLLNPRGTLNRLFALTSLLLGAWAFSESVIQTLTDERQMWIWYRVTSIGLIATPALTLHFYLRLSGRRAVVDRWWALGLLYAPAIPFWIRVWSGPLVAEGFQPIPGGIAEIAARATPWALAFTAYFLGYTLVGLFSVYRWGRRARLRSERLQAALIVVLGTVSIVLTTTSNVVLPMLHLDFMPSLGAVAILPWAIGIAYATVRLKLMTLTVQSASNDILRTMGDGVILLGWDRRIIIANAAVTGILGVGRERLVGRHIDDVIPKLDVVRDLEPEHLVPGRPITNIEIAYETGSARRSTLSISASSVVDRHGESIGIVLVVRDVSELRQSEEKLKFMATHDPLTGLPNRFLLNDRLRMALANGQRHGIAIAVMLLDLDNFKTINDTLGHGAGDQVLRLLSETVSRCLRSNDTLARMGGDEFVVVLSDIKRREEVEIVASRIYAALAQPLHIGSDEILATMSMGISMFPEDGDDIELLLRNADVAMYRAKESGKNAYRFCSEPSKEEGARRLVNEQTLRVALDERQFALHFQPIFELDGSRVWGAEALLRWNHPAMGLITAQGFVPAAERAGLIAPIGDWVIEEVCRQRRRWRSTAAGGVPISINLSAKHFQRDDFVETVERLIRESGADATGLIFELTESAAIKDVDQTRRTMGRLVRLGIRFMIDDFGTGYSSLRWLKNLPVSAIKIDKLFVQHMSGDTDSLAILRAIIAMAHSLSLEVVAEGVETREQADRLASMDWGELPSLRCNHVQGYYYSRPMTPEDFERSVGS